MKKVLIGIAVLLVVAVATVLVAPSFIDWNRYKDEITAWVESRTGRDLTVGGDLSLSILPSPTLRATEVAFANAPEGTAEHLVRMEALDVTVDLVPLLGGRIRVESVRLVRPVVVLETLPDGSGNWLLTPPPEGANGTSVGGAMPGAPADEPEAPAAGGGAGGDGLAVALESLVVEDGTVVWRDADGVETRVDSLGAEVAAESLLGPFQGTADMVVRGAPLTAEVRVGRLTAGEAAFLAVTLGLPEADAEGTVQGRLAGLDGSGETSFNGVLTAEGPSLARALAAVQAGQQEAALDKPFRLGGDLSVAPAALGLDGMTLRLGDTEGTGGIALAMDEAPHVDVALAFTRIDLDALLKEAHLRLPAGAPPRSTGGIIPAAAPAVPGGDAATEAALLPNLPPDLTGGVDISADVMTWRGGIIRDARLSASLAGSEVTLNEVAALLPGSSEINAFGFVDTAATPAAVDGTAELKSSNLRDLLTWLGADVAGVPADRLRRFNATAAVQGTAAELRMPSLEGRLDLTRFQGAAAVRVAGERPALGLSLSLDSLNVDAYTANGQAGVAPAPEPAEEGAAEGEAPAQGEAPAREPLFAGLGVLNAFDANIKARAGLLTWRDTEIRDVGLDVALVDGVATFGETAVGGLAGAALRVGGGLSGFGGEPVFQRLNVGVSTDAPERLARLLNVDLPVPAAGLAPLGVSITLDGTLEALGLSTSSRAAGATLNASGSLRDALAAPAYELDVSVEHESIPAFLSRLGVSYEPRAGGGLGPLSLTATASGTADRVALADLTARLGPSTFTGAATVDLAAAERPQVSADLAVDTLPLADFLPAEQTAALERAVGGIVPAAFRAAPALDARPARARPAQAAAPRWSTEPLEITGLDAVDADLSLTAGALSYEGWRLRDAALTATLAAGRLDVPALTGVLFGGPLTASGTIAPAADGAVTLTLATALENMDLSTALDSVAGEPAARGRMDMRIDVAATGASEAALVAGLNGSGRLVLRKVDTRRTGDTKGTALAAILAPLRALDRLGGALGGEGYGVDVTGDFTVEQGVVRSREPVTIRSNLYDGALSGAANLPAWTVDAEGQVRLSHNALTQLLSSQIKLPEVVPVALSGPLDQPNVRIGTGRQAEGAAGEQPVKPEKQARDAVKRLLQEELGVGGGESAPPAGEEGEQAPQPKPEKVLRDSLKNLLLGN